MCDQIVYHILNVAIILPFLKMKVFSGRSRREFNLVSAGASSQSRSDLSLATRKRSRERNDLESSDDSTVEGGSNGLSLAGRTNEQNSSRRVKPTLPQRPVPAPEQKQKQKQRAVKRAQYEYVSLADAVHHMHKLVNVYAVRTLLLV
jgi:hypothetical protein